MLLIKVSENNDNFLTQLSIYGTNIGNALHLSLSTFLLILVLTNIGSIGIISNLQLQLNISYSTPENSFSFSSIIFLTISGFNILYALIRFCLFGWALRSLCNNKIENAKLPDGFHFWFCLIDAISCL